MADSLFPSYNDPPCRFRGVPDRSRTIKGPSLQHHLKPLRVWTCPVCNRSVQDHGSVTSRVCECRDTPRMLLTEPARLGPPDVSQFVTYMAPEFLEDEDDGTDLPVPDIESLRPAPHPNDRRRVMPPRPERPAPMTDESLADPAAETEAEVSTSEPIAQHPPSAGIAETDSEKLARPRGRRRLRGREQTGEQSSASRKPSDAGPAEATQASMTSDAPADPSKEKTSSPAGRRRRRARRRPTRKSGGKEDT